MARVRRVASLGRGVVALVLIKVMCCVGPVGYRFVDVLLLQVPTFSLAPACASPACPSMAATSSTEWRLERDAVCAVPLSMYVVRVEIPVHWPVCL